MQTIFATSKFKARYENEYRYIGIDSGKHLINNPPSCLYLGKCIDKENEKKLLRIAKTKNIPLVKKILTVPWKYELTTETIYTKP